MIFILLYHDYVYLDCIYFTLNLALFPLFFLIIRVISKRLGRIAGQDGSVAERPGYLTPQM